MEDDIRFVEKPWGYERWFANNDRYCGKEIFVTNRVFSSGGRFHYHKIKDETFYVIYGKLHIEYGENGDNMELLVMGQGGRLRVRPGVKHRFRAVEGGCLFIEVSTHHEDSDSYRCRWDAVHKEWVPA